MFLIIFDGSLDMFFQRKAVFELRSWAGDEFRARPAGEASPFDDFISQGAVVEAVVADKFSGQLMAVDIVDIKDQLAVSLILDMGRHLAHFILNSLRQGEDRRAGVFLMKGGVFVDDDGIAKA